GIHWTGVRSPDRSVSSHVARLGDVVVVTNSTAQLARLAAVWRGEAPALASLDEYRFFRDRHPRGAADETALLVLSDATIRRWCGPRWRIGASRRLRAAALLAEETSRRVESLLADSGASGVPGVSAA